MSQDLLTTMRQRLADAESDAERLRDAISILEDATQTLSPTRRRTSSAPTEAPDQVVPNAAPPPSAPARRSRRPSPGSGTNVVAQEKLMAALSDHPGQTTTQLARLTGGEPSQLLVLLREAETAGTARREGQRRATRWFSYTDEDRIAARVEELQATS